jgi:hypothetical protein
VLAPSAETSSPVLPVSPELNTAEPAVTVVFAATVVTVSIRCPTMACVITPDALITACALAVVNMLAWV